MQVRAHTATLLSCLAFVALSGCRKRNFQGAGASEATGPSGSTVRAPWADEREGITGLICALAKDVETHGEASGFRSFVKPLPECREPVSFAASFQSLFVRPQVDNNSGFLGWGLDHPQEREVDAAKGYRVEAYKPIPLDAEGHLPPGIGKTVHAYGVCFSLSNCFKVFRLESDAKRYWIFGEIPGSRLADVPVFVQQSAEPWDFSKGRVINLRETLIEWLDAHPLPTVDIYRTGGSGEGFVDLYRNGDPSADYTDHYSPGTPVVHFAHNVRYAEAGEFQQVSLAETGLVKAAIPAAAFREMLVKNELQIHVLRNSVVTYPIVGGIYADEAGTGLLGGLPMEFLLKRETARALVEYSRSENGGYQGMFCSFPGLRLSCAQVRMQEVDR